MKNSKAQIAETWDKIASKHGSYRRKTWPQVSDFLAKASAPILDIGCGNASYHVSGRAAGTRKVGVIGIDISFKTCKLASKNCTPICADASSLPIKNSSFSRVISVATVHHLPSKTDRENFFADLRRVLKPSGEALVTALYQRGPRKNTYLKWGAEKRYYHLFSKRELTNLANKYFTNVELNIEKDAKHKNIYLYIQK